MKTLLAQVQPEVLGPSGVVPALLILFLLLAFGGVYVYHWAFRDREGFSRGGRRSSEGDRQDSASSSTTRRTSSDIRISKKAEARSRCRRLEDDPRMGRGLSPRRPPRYIRPKLLDSTVQTSDSSTSKHIVPDVKAKAVSPVPPPRQRLIRGPHPDAEDAPVKVVRDAEAAGSGKGSNGRPHHAKPDEEAQTATVPTQMPQQKTASPPRPSSDQVEICIEVHKPNHDDRKAQRLSSAPSPAGLRSSRQKPRQPPRVQEDTKPLKPSWLKMISGVMPFQGFFDRGKGRIPRRSLLRQRTTSTEMIITTDAAVQLEKPAMVDDSQQVSEAPVTGKEQLSTPGSAVLKILESSPKQTNLEGTERHPDDAFVVYQAETNVFKSQMVAVTRSGQSDHSPSLTTSQPVNRGSKFSLVHHQPFCGSDEGPLAPSPSTSLSFVSSESGHNVMHPLTDLALLRGLLPCRRPKYETGDGKSRTGQLSRALSAGTHTEEAATRTSQQAFGRTQQSSVGDRRRGSSVWPRTGARQALAPMSPRGPSWAAAIGTQHYFRERYPFPRAPTPDSVTAPNQTEYGFQQKKSSLASLSADATPEDPSRPIRPSTAKSEVFLTRSTTGLYRSSPCFQDSSNSSRNNLFLQPLRLRDLVVLRYPQFRWLTTNEAIAPREDAKRRREASPAVLVHEALYPRPTQDREDTSSTPEPTLDSAQVAQLGVQTKSELCLQDSSKSSMSSLGRRKMNVLTVEEGELSAFFSFEESSSNTSLLPDATSLRFSEDSLSDTDASSSNQDDGNCAAN
ncbi:hypothetical protein ISCGN_026358 [Ixodes scapularis]